MIRQVLAVAAATATAATVFAAPAGADPADRVATAICTTLTDAPNVATVDSIGMWLVLEGGADAETAAAAMVYAVHEYCPQHWNLLQRYAKLADKEIV